ncbi:MAG: hypothetical protein HY816_19960 [Candidatus Wallbacteria bacterium]|nr:hypothetical protein [Candidatus Wallbacteria bacterium]
MTFVPLNPDEQEIKATTLKGDQAALTAQLAATQTAKDAAALVDDIYLRHEQAGYDLLNDQLELKKAALDTSSPAFAPHVIVYLAAHPSQGEGDSNDGTAWEIQKKSPNPMANPPPPGDVVYSHTVNWDSNPLILHGEDQETTFHQLRWTPGFGSKRRLDGMTGAVDLLTAWLALIVQRDIYFEY